jgi:hypothetical protein
MIGEQRVSTGYVRTGSLPNLRDLAGETEENHEKPVRVDKL